MTKRVNLSPSKRICFVIPSLKVGGMERVMSLIANHIVCNQKIELHIILYGSTRELFYEINEDIEIHQPNFTYFSGRKLLSTARTLRYLRTQIRLINPTSILSFGEYWNTFALISLVGLNYPIIVSDRCQPDKKLKFPHQTLRKILYKRASKVIVQTAIAKDIYSHFIKRENINVIGNPIQTYEPSNKRKENIVLSVGRLIKSKNFDQLINIFSQTKNNDWKLFIIGDDSNKQKTKAELQNIINNNNLTNKVFLLGTKQNVSEYYQTAKLFAFTSESEGFPNVIGEAMANELPVIAYDCVAGPSELIKDNVTGFLIPLYSENLFVEKLNQLMESSELRKDFGRNSLEYVKQFSTGVISNKFLAELT